MIGTLLKLPYRGQNRLITFLTVNFPLLTEVLPMENNTRFTDASEFAENFVASVLLLQLLNEAKQAPLLERVQTLDHIATLLLATYPPAQA